MSNSVQSLWPDKIEMKPLPAPVRILREQGLALNDMTGGALYGEVLRSNFPSVTAATYDFYIGVSNRPYRHKLLSVECGFLFDFPVTIVNHEASVAIRVNDENAFREQIQLQLNSDVTKELLGRLLTFAKC